MTMNHVDPRVFDRLFDDRLGKPLGARELDVLRRHVDDCRGCRGEFDRRRMESRRGEDVLTEGQVATILNVVLERGREIEAAPNAGPSASPRAVAAAGRLVPNPAWAPRLRWALGAGGALAAACAAFLLLPASRSGEREWGARGGESVPSPSQQLHCYDAAAGTARPLVEEAPTCDPGRTVSIEARGLGDFRWVSVVACDAAGCRLLDSQPFEDRPTVSLFGPTMAEHGASTVFTVWSKRPIRDSEVQDTVKTIRSRGGAPDGANELPFGQATKQLVARVRSQRAPS